MIEGLEDGNVAVLSKVHHAAIDGASGNEMTVALLDLTPEIAEHEPDEEWVPDRVPDRRRAAHATRPPRWSASPSAWPGPLGKTAGGALAVRRRNRAQPNLAAAAVAVLGAAHVVQHGHHPAPELRLHVGVAPHGEGGEERHRRHGERRRARPLRRRAPVATSTRTASTPTARSSRWCRCRCAATTRRTRWATG